MHIDANTLCIDGVPVLGSTAQTIQIDRGDLADVRFVFDENDDKWKVGEVGNEIALVTAPEIAGFAAASSVYTKTESDARYLSAGITIDGGVL